MADILDFIVQFCSLLWLEARYRIVDSEVTLSFGGDASLIVASESLRLMFIRDRGQLFFRDFQGPASASRKWLSMDIVHRFLTDKNLASSELDAEYVCFICEHLLDIESIFSNFRMPETRSA